MAVRSFLDVFPDDTACLNHLFAARFGAEAKCPQCARQTRWYLMGNSAFACFRCRYRLWPKRGTPFENSKLPLRMWFHCVLLMTQLPKSVSAQFVKRYFGISETAAWRMCDRIRSHIADQATNKRIGGPGIQIQIDETLLTNVRENDNARNLKICVFGMTDGTNFLTMTVPDRTARTLLPLVHAHVRRGSIISTDGWRAYCRIGEHGYTHRKVNHKAGIWVGADGANTLVIDSYWGLLKRFLRRTHVQIRENRVDIYLREFRMHHENRFDRQAWFWQTISQYRPYDNLLGHAE